MFALFIVLSVIVGFASSQSSTTMPSSSSMSTSEAESWQDLGTMAIRAVTELSRVCIVASRRDYRLDTSRPYTYLSYPSSYRASLTQATDIVERVFRTTESSVSRLKMMMGQVPSQLNTAITVLFDGTIDDRKIFLPSTLSSIANMGKNAGSVLETVSTGLEQAIAFFEELLQAVQPSPPPSTTSDPSGSTSTQANRSPLDIDHATALSNILVNLKSLRTIWNQMVQYSGKLAVQANGAAQFMNDRNTLLWALSDIDESASFFTDLADSYTEMSMKIITPSISSMGNYLILQSEEERFAEVQKVNQRADKDILRVQKFFAEVMAIRETDRKERNEKYNSLASKPSA